MMSPMRAPGGEHSVGTAWLSAASTATSPRFDTTVTGIPATTPQATFIGSAEGASLASTVAALGEGCTEN